MNYMYLAGFLNIKFSFHFDRSCLRNYVTALKYNSYHLLKLLSVRNRARFIVINKPSLLRERVLSKIESRKRMDLVAVQKRKKSGIESFTRWLVGRARGQTGKWLCPCALPPLCPPALVPSRPCTLPPLHHPALPPLHPPTLAPSCPCALPLLCPCALLPLHPPTLVPLCPPALTPSCPCALPP